MAVKDGNTVRVHYTGTFSDGEVFDSSREREPLEFTIGDGSLIPGFEDALLGHNAGDRFTVTIPADEAYGEHLEELLMEVPVSEVPEDIKPEVGMMLQIATDDGDADTVRAVLDTLNRWKSERDKKVDAQKKEQIHRLRRPLTVFWRYPHVLPPV